LDDEFGGKRELAVVADHKADTILKNEVHLAHSGMADLDLDEHRLGKRPRFGGINFRHSWKMTGIEPGREISTKAAFQSLTVALGG
jgi:hypothetical protein